MKQLLTILLISFSLAVLAQNNDSNKPITFNVKKENTNNIDIEGLYVYIAIDYSKGERYLNKEPGYGDISSSYFNNPKCHIVAFYNYFEVDSIFYNISLIAKDTIVFKISISDVYFGDTITKTASRFIPKHSNTVDGFTVEGFSDRQFLWSYNWFFANNKLVISVDKVILADGRIIKNPEITNKKELFNKNTNTKIAEGAVFTIKL